MAPIFKPNRSCAQVIEPPLCCGAVGTCLETLDKLAKTFDEGSPPQTMDLEELQAVLEPLMIDENPSNLKMGAAEAIDIFLSTLTDQEMKVAGSPVHFTPGVFTLFKTLGMARMERLEFLQDFDSDIQSAPRLQKLPQPALLSQAPSPISPNKKKIIPPATFQEWFQKQAEEMPWKLPSISLDVVFGGELVMPYFGSGVYENTAMVFPRLLMDIPLELIRFLWNYWGEDRTETPSGRFLNTLGALPIILAKSYIVHESGHVRRNAEYGWDQSLFNNSVPAIMENAGGLEATQQHSEEMMRSPYAGPEGDVSRFVFQEDLMFYRRVSEYYIASRWDVPAPGMIDGKGDPLEYLHDRSEINGGLDESWAVEMVAAWETLDPEAIRSLFRWYNYIQTGEISSNVFKRGYATAAFNGYLAPGGPLLEASGYYYLDSPSIYPSFIKGTLWYSPVEPLKDKTMGIGVELYHFPIPQLDLMGIHFAVGGEFSIWNQKTHLPYYSFQHSSKTYSYSSYKFPSTLLGGALSLYLEKKPVALSLSALCKNTGYLPQAPMNGGCYPNATLHINFGDPVQAPGK